jgi:hypothetical protein
MAHGTARAAAAACLGLIALQAAGTKGGAGRLASLLGDVNSVVTRALDPGVPAIPDLRNGGSWGAPTVTVGQAAAAAATWRPVALR